MTYCITVRLLQTVPQHICTLVFYRKMIQFQLNYLSTYLQQLSCNKSTTIHTCRRSICVRISSFIQIGRRRFRHRNGRLEFTISAVTATDSASTLTMYTMQLLYHIDLVTSLGQQGASAVMCQLCSQSCHQ